MYKHKYNQLFLLNRLRRLLNIRILLLYLVKIVELDFLLCSWFHVIKHFSETLKVEMQFEFQNAMDIKIIEF